MIWKILFGLFSVLLGGFFTVALIIGDYTASVSNLSDSLFAIGASIVLFTALGALYSLATNKNFLPKICAYTGSALFGIGLIHLIYESFVEFSKEEVELFSQLNILGIIIIAIILLGGFLFIFFPIVIPLIAYFVKEKALPIIEKPFFRIYSLCFLLIYQIPVVVSSIYNIFIDKDVTLIYAILLLQANIWILIASYNVAFAKFVLPKKFWQISLVPQLLIIGLFPEKTDLSFVETIKNSLMFAQDKLSPVLIGFTIALIVLTVLMVYRYAFTDRLDEIKVIEENK